MGDYEGEVTLCAKYNVPAADHRTNKIAKEIFRDSKVLILDYHKLLASRGDLHIKRDCSHFCWNSEMYNGIFRLMIDTLKT